MRCRPLLRWATSCTLGLNMFLAVSGCRPGRVLSRGAQQIGFGFFIWGTVVTTVPIILSLYIGKYIFRFDDAVVLVCCTGARA